MSSYMTDIECKLAEEVSTLKEIIGTAENLINNQKEIIANDEKIIDNLKMANELRKRLLEANIGEIVTEEMVKEIFE